MEKTQDKFPLKIFIGLMLIGAGGLYLLTNLQGLFFVTVSETLGVTRSQFSLYYTVQCLAAMFTGLFAGQLIEKFKTKFNIFLVVIVLIQVIGFFLFSRANTLALFFVVAIFLGFANALDLHIIIGIVVSNWFIKKKGLIMGIVMAMSSIMGAVLSPTIAVLVNDNWRNGYLLISIGTLITMIPAALLVKYAPEMVGRKAWGASEAANSSAAIDTTGVKYGVALKSPAFYCCALFLFCATGWACLTNAFPGYIVSIGYSAVFVGYCSSSYMVGGILGKLVCGYLIDKLGVVKSLFVITALGIIGMLLLIFVAPAASWGIIAGGVLFGLGMGVLGVYPAIVVRTCFGNKDYPKIYSNINMLMWVSSMVLIPIYNFIYDSTGSYVPGMWAAVVFLVLCIVLSAIALKNAKTLPREV